MIHFDSIRTELDVSVSTGNRWLVLMVIGSTAVIGVAEGAVVGSNCVLSWSRRYSVSWRNSGAVESEVGIPFKEGAVLRR